MAVQAKTATTWRGTPSEQQDLLAAVQHHCSCVYAEGACTSVCAGHRMLVEDQRALDGLLCMRRLAARLRHEEEVVRGTLSEPAAQTGPRALSWSSTTEETGGPAALLEPSSLEWPFSAAELARLAAYRTAIQAGFYTDF